MIRSKAGRWRSQWHARWRGVREMGKSRTWKSVNGSRPSLALSFLRCSSGQNVLSRDASQKTPEGRKHVGGLGELAGGVVGVKFVFESFW